MRRHAFNFLFVELDLVWSAARDDNNTLRLLLRRVKQQPSSDVDCHVSHANDRYMLSGRVVSRNIRSELVVVVDEVLCSIDAVRVFTGKSQFLGALGSAGKYDRGG